MRRATPQLLDPLGGLTARYFTVLTAAIAVVVATVTVATHAGDISSWGLQALALASLAAVAVIVVDGTSARRFPFRGTRHGLIQVVGVTAIALDVASRSAGQPQFSTWGSTCLAVLILLIGSYRPAREIVVVSAASVIAVAVITAVVSAQDLPPSEFIALCVGRCAPIAAIAIGAAAFSSTLVSRLREWRASSADRHRLERLVVRDALLPEINERRAELLEYRVGPFLQDLLDRDSITVSDVSRARGLATALRSNMVADANATWISHEADDVRDATRAVETMTIDQRTALGAVLAELRSASSLVAGSLTVSVTEGAPQSTLTISAQLVPSTSARIRPAAYLAVLRTHFEAATVTRTPESITVTLRF